MIGLVLCGGESKRMGSDKALLPMANKTWVEVAHNKLLAVQIPVYISVNTNQLATFTSLFTAEQLIVDDSNITIGGPLMGLLSAHQQHCNEAILLLACDMPNITTQVLQHLQTVSYQTNFETVVYNNQGQIEPLCAIYSARVLQKTVQLYTENKLYKPSIKQIHKFTQPTVINVPAAWQNCFMNCNSKTDLANL